MNFTQWLITSRLSISFLIITLIYAVGVMKEYHLFIALYHRMKIKSRHTPSKQRMKYGEITKFNERTHRIINLVCTLSQFGETVSSCSTYFIDKIPYN